MIYFLLLYERNGGVDTECTEDADEAILHLHGVVPVSMYVVLDGVRGYGPHRRAIQNSWACCECIFVREGCEVGVCVCVCMRWAQSSTLEMIRRSGGDPLLVERERITRIQNNLDVQTQFRR
jgi:hypothetical protein